MRSQTGELMWDYGTGKVTVNAPQAQGVTGFLSKAGSIELLDVTIASALDYGAIVLIALDGKPLNQSGKMLLQVMSEESNYGWEAPGTGLRTIQNTGSAPLIVKRLNGIVSLKRPDAAQLTVTALDFNGYPSKKLKGAASLNLLENTLYYLIEK